MNKWLELVYVQNKKKSEQWIVVLSLQGIKGDPVAAASDRAENPAYSHTFVRTM